MTKYYKRKVVSGSSNEEKLEDIITSTTEEPKHVTALWFTEITATTENNDAILRAYVEREQIIDMSIRQLLYAMDVETRHSRPRLEVDIDLPEGQSLSVGCVSGGTATNLEVVAEYEITS